MGSGKGRTYATDDEDVAAGASPLNMSSGPVYPLLYGPGKKKVIHQHVRPHSLLHCWCFRTQRHQTDWTTKLQIFHQLTSAQLFE